MQLILVKQEPLLLLQLLLEHKQLTWHCKQLCCYAPVPTCVYIIMEFAHAKLAGDVILCSARYIKVERYFLLQQID